MRTTIGVGSVGVIFLLVACSGVELGAKDQPKDKDKDASAPKNNCGLERETCNKDDQCCTGVCRTEIGQCACFPTFAVCQSSAQCCFGAPCTQEPSGVFRCAPVCIPSDFCTTASDCCNGTPCLDDGTGVHRCATPPP
jgi:hypothetical protein